MTPGRRDDVARSTGAAATRPLTSNLAAALVPDGVIECARPLSRRTSIVTATRASPYAIRPPRAHRALDRDGFQIHVHAIGDRAIRMTLDALERAAAANGPRDRRDAIAHLELIDPADIPRFRRLGVVANFQARWANGDEYLTRMTEPALGPARNRWLYPIASVVRSGAVVAGGSDWSVSPPDPLERSRSASPRGWATPRAAMESAGARISDDAALYTINAAWLTIRHETGSIEAGSRRT
jgi:predicted amidohydrolase YtcJ